MEGHKAVALNGTRLILTLLQSLHKLDDVSAIILPIACELPIRIFGLSKIAGDKRTFIRTVVDSSTVWFCNVRHKVGVIDCDPFLMPMLAQIHNIAARSLTLTFTLLPAST